MQILEATTNNSSTQTQANTLRWDLSALKRSHTTSVWTTANELRLVVYPYSLIECRLDCGNAPEFSRWPLTTKTRRVRKQTIPGKLGRAPSTGESHPSKLPKLVLPFTHQIWLENSLLRVQVGLHHGLSVCWQRGVKMGRNL